VALEAFTDNYIWMLHDGRAAMVVDPGDAAPVATALQALGLQLQAILVTHHHADHVGGVDALRPRLHGQVFAPAAEQRPRPAVLLDDGAHVEVLGLGFEVMQVPGHTAGHIAYVQRSGPGADTAPLLFCGDTLFSAGCGRLFEGTPQQMHASLARLAALPGATQVCCTHEYTLANLRFAAAVEPDNADIAAHTRHCLALRERGQPTLPSTIALEQRINPFIRCEHPGVVTAALAHGAAGHEPVQVLAALREWKNTFR
jgi:hydroxyacylglutathione hydrolase